MSLVFRHRWSRVIGLVFFTLLVLIPPSLAHHPTGGKTPVTFLDGFLSGLGHPVIGLDHLAFVIAAGLIAAGLTGGLFIPVSFVLATLIGTGIHLQEINLIAPEAIVSFSVIIFGLLIAFKSRLHFPDFLSIVLFSTLAIIAGIFHGYAYGEAIIGARSESLLGYLLGFFLIQLVISVLAFTLAKKILNKPLVIRNLGLAITSIGLIFLVRI